jgi:uncharacterized membrane protein YvbJ
MSWLTKLQNKPQKEKIKILWATLISIVVLLIAAWIIIGNVKPKAEKDTRLFQTINQGIKDFHVDKPNIK